MAKGPANKPAGNGGDGRALAAVDNEAAILDAERAQLISYVSKIIQQKRETAKAREAYKAEQDKETELFRIAKLASPRFLRARLERYIGKLTGGARSRDIAEEARIERQHEEWLNIPTGEVQLELFTGKSTPTHTRDEAFWRAEGYLSYQRGDECKAPDDCPSAFVQAFAAGWNDGQAATIWAMKKVAETAGPEQADPTGALNDPQARGGDDFETPEAELQGQTTRRVLQEQRAAAESEAV